MSRRSTLMLIAVLFSGRSQWRLPGTIHKMYHCRSSSLLYGLRNHLDEINDTRKAQELTAWPGCLSTSQRFSMRILISVGVPYRDRSSFPKTEGITRLRGLRQLQAGSPHFGNVSIKHLSSGLTSTSLASQLSMLKRASIWCKLSCRHIACYASASNMQTPDSTSNSYPCIVNAVP